MKCKYCGLSAGLSSRVYKECEEKQQQKIAKLLVALRAYFVGNDSIVSVTNTIQSAKNHYYRNYAFPRCVVWTYLLSYKGIK